MKKKEALLKAYLKLPTLDNYRAYVNCPEDEEVVEEEAKTPVKPAKKMHARKED